MSARGFVCRVHAKETKDYADYALTSLFSVTHSPLRLMIQIIPKKNSVTLTLANLKMENF